MASAQTTLLHSTAQRGLPDCEWRVGTRSPEIFYCRHSRVHAANDLVDVAICRGCERYSEPSFLPRRLLHDPLAPREQEPAPSGLEYISLERLAADVRALIGRLPTHLSGVAGIPRSGLIPAAQIALALHLPLFELCTGHGLRSLGHGQRLADRVVPDGPLLVVDDSIGGGGALYSARQALQKFHPELKVLIAVLYPVLEALPLLDFYVRPLKIPHLFEWNLFNSDQVCASAMDFDGVFCDDWCGADEEGAEYETFLQTAAPRWLPRYATVPLVVTARLERHRALTEGWLARHGVRCERLVMGPWKSSQERNRAYHAGRFKGKEYADSRCTLFIESDEEQAALIFEEARKPVLCPRAGRIFQ